MARGWTGQVGVGEGARSPMVGTLGSAQRGPGSHGLREAGRSWSPACGGTDGCVDGVSRGRPPQCTAVGKDSPAPVVAVPVPLVSTAPECTALVRPWRSLPVSAPFYRSGNPGGGSHVPEAPRV